MRRNILLNSDSIRILKSRTGAALMLALFASTLLMVIAVDIMYETSAEYVMTSQAINRVRAYWAARAGVEMSLLRIHIFRQAAPAVAKMLPDTSILDQIWKQPFVWPPVVPKDVSHTDQGQIQKAVKASDLSALKVSYLATIDSEGAKIDINDLGSPSKIMSEAASKQLLQLLKAKTESDEEFGRKYRGENFQELINNIADWIDADDTGRNGGDEKSKYSQVPGGSLLPRNQPLQSLEELHLVEGMNDEFFDIIAPAVTLYGAKGININQATKEVFTSFGPQFTKERVEQILKDRNDPRRGPFKNEKDFMDYLSSIGITGNIFENEDKSKTPLLFEAETNFRVRATGKSGHAQVDIVAIVYDPEKIQSRLEQALVQQAQSQTPPTQQSPAPIPGGAAPTQTPAPAPAETQTTPLKRPKIIYWNEQ